MARHVIGSVETHAYKVFQGSIGREELGLLLDALGEVLAKL